MILRLNRVPGASGTFQMKLLAMPAAEGTTTASTPSLPAIGAQVAPAQAQQGGVAAAARQAQGIRDADAVLPAQGAEILKGRQVDVGRVVPMEGQRTGDRHPALEAQAQAVPPVSKVREADNAFARHAQHFAQHQPRLAHHLERLAEHGIVVGLIGNHAQALVQVALEHVQPLAQHIQQVLEVDVHAQAGHAFADHQLAQQRSVAAAKVQDPRAGPDLVDNAGVIRAVQIARLGPAPGPGLARRLGPGGLGAGRRGVGVARPYERLGDGPAPLVNQAADFRVFLTGFPLSALLLLLVARLNLPSLGQYLLQQFKVGHTCAPPPTFWPPVQKVHFPCTRAAHSAGR